MNLEPLLLLSGTFVVLLAGVLARQTVLAIRARRRERRRKVEAPNSHYDPRAVRNLETRQRWAGIRLERVHEINRVEVERLQRKIEAFGVDSLRPPERQFMDVMLEISGQP